VPIHRHPGIEAFFVISGQVEVFTEPSEKPHWIAAGPGDFIEVPSNAKHGFRNSSIDPVVQLITTTSKLGRFFQEIGRSITRGARLSPPSPAELQHFVMTSERYGYWLASSEENASAGIPFLASCSHLIRLSIFVAQDCYEPMQRLDLERLCDDNHRVQSQNSS
jgi:Cupin domain